MVAAPASCSNTSGADIKARVVAVKSEPVDVEYAEDPVLPFGSSGGKVTEDEHGDSTECSSSFGDSGFVSDDDVESDAGIMEVKSPLYSHINVDDFSSVSHTVRSLRKEKVTADWRKFIGPERWRCQWLELRMKDLLAQVAKYDKELALINHEKCLQLEMIKADRCKSELYQIDLPNYETMKRKKRKRHEDSTDTSAYIKKHQIFSYYNHEHKKSTPENERIGDNEVIDDFNNLDVEDTKSNIGSNDTLLESKENAVLEQYSLRKILLAIECIQTRIINLQSDLSEAYNKIDHPQKSQKKKDSHGVRTKKNVVRPYGTTHPDEDETTLEMLFGANSYLLDPHIDVICKHSADDVLIDNKAAIEEEFCPFERITRAETYSEPIINVDEAPTVKLVKKGGPKPKKKHSSAQSKEENTATGLDYPNTGNTMFVAVDTRKSQRVRKPKMF